ncbi:MAG: Gfo/Idh/MocA family oxidoreductase [Planctomycetota bacterium]|nr:Gfo/Idh/MocA family oxidoreductase [Planctomycetota bacterium]
MSATKVVRIGFVGGGYMGQLAHIEKYWKLPGVELVAIAEGRPKTAALVAKTYGIQEVYGHHTELLKNAKVDAIVAILPFALNAEVVEDAIKAGKHIITEKPQVNRSDKGHELVDLAKKKGVVYQVGYMKRFDPGVRWAKARIAQWRESGAFGPMMQVRIWCAGGAWQWFREPALNAGDEPAKYPTKFEPKWDWMAEDEWNWKGHQGWTNYYSHQTNLARYIAGEDYKLEYAKRTAGGHHILCGYVPSGVNLYLDFTSHFHNQWDEGFEVRFGRAKLTAKMPSPLATRQIADVTAYECPEKGEAHEYRPILPSVDGFTSQAQQFVASIRGEEPALSPASDAVKEVEFSESLIKFYGKK